MKKYLLLIAAFALLFAPLANAAMTNFETFTAEGANVSVDAVGLQDNTEGFVSAEIPDNATIEAAYLYSASVWSNSLHDVIFEGNTLTSDASSRLDTGVKDANPASENRWDVTSIVNTKYTNDTSLGTYDFSVTELGYLDGEILAVLYSVPSEPVQTAFIFDGELATGGDQFQIAIEAFDGSDAIFSLGISYGYQGSGQFTLVDVNGQRMTSSAGGQDDGYGANGGLITAGGLGDDPNANPADPNAGPGNDPRYDDELYNLALFLKNGDTLITIDTLNPSNDDNVFFASLVVKGEAAVIPPNGVPEPTTMLLLGFGLLGLAGFRSRFKKS